MNLMASPTVTIDSAASSGISIPNSSSNAMTSSTVSRLSAPKSSMKLAPSLTFSASTFRCSTTIFFTRSATSLIFSSPLDLSCLYSATACGFPPGNKPVPVEPWLERSRLVTHSPPSRQFFKSLFWAKALDHRHAAIDVQGLPRHIGGFLACKIGYGGGHVSNLAQASGRNSGQQRRTLILGQCIGHGRGDEPRGHRIDRDRAGGHFGRQRLGHADETGLGRGVIALTGIAGHADDRRDGDDAPPTLLHHVAQARAR